MILKREAYRLKIISMVRFNINVEILKIIQRRRSFMFMILLETDLYDILVLFIP